MPSHNYALHNLDPAYNATLLKSHRDLAAHEMRWDFVSRQFEGESYDEWWNYRERYEQGNYYPTMLKYSHFARIYVGRMMEGTLVDLGCGPEAYMARMLFTNRRHVKHYIGMDYRGARPSWCDSGRKEKPNFPFDIVKGDVTKWTDYDQVRNLLQEKDHQEFPDGIVTLEVLEHMPKASGLLFLENIHRLAGPKTTIFLSTPCYDNVHLAAEHIYEWRWDELKEELEHHFIIEGNWGTFASQKDLNHHLTLEEREIFRRLEVYYDASVMSTLFAPLYPQYSRNSIWKLRAA